MDKGVEAIQRCAVLPWIASSLRPRNDAGVRGSPVPRAPRPVPRACAPYPCSSCAPLKNPAARVPLALPSAGCLGADQYRSSAYPSDRKQIGPHPFQAVGENICGHHRQRCRTAADDSSMDPAGAGYRFSARCLRRHPADWIAQAISSRGITGDEPSYEGTPHDPERDLITLPLVLRRGGTRFRGAGRAAAFRRSMCLRRQPLAKSAKRLIQ